ncbi:MULTISPECIES: carboxylesterase/lipase family protein [Rhodococcus]|uniref:Carboxylic ester hydrolase n=2 Tax=Rhodococcus TaxID=1827 RepID=A0ABQ0YFQ1_9NOCA|nr:MULTISPECIES: carboxylesterase/lipase family protein [Rhodococcus]ETT28516.1 Carboxylesterase [Rhodococcus rhodochrous ATCC 21198]AKE89484.1 carboxylesterase [Rhodococcus aetherivorans]MDV6292303.1 carboxylesterase/lipase family protein [Rhodococcus aetherivorans]NGP27403.1 carboxylesterase/lipase family protein [Rhodococcus aetherivorans]USC17354.1 carboxylesterase/lipase family protein [Rhodococcus sp. 11-3]
MDAETLIVGCKYGDVRGYRDGSVYAWKGVPYAAPASGDLRFRAPEPPEPWTDVLDARRFGPIAPQGRNNPIPIDPGLSIGEDCLSLNIWAPEPDGEPRPVMVWIHGGAYVLGYSGQRIYDGRLLAERGDVVVVTVNYRLGALGFLDFSSFSTAGTTFESNVGLRDQIAALEWVRDCISAFGGDPDRVTVFGESSGGGSLTTLMTVPRAEGLFHRAIAQSPPATSAYGSERAARVAERFLEILDLTPARVWALRDMPHETLTDAGDVLVGEIPTKFPGTLAMAPVVDRDLVPKYPVAAFQKGLAHRIPLIIGSNKDEPSIFRFMKSPLMPVSDASVQAMLDALAADHPELPPDRIAEIISAYPDVSKTSGAMALSRDAGFRMPVVWIADAHSAHSPTWVYRFDHATPMLKAARIGAGHATELPYVFGNFGTLDRDPTFWLGGRKAATVVSGRIQRRWLAFAHHGVPAALDGSRHWAPYDTGKRMTLLIDSTDTLVSDPDRVLREAWGDQVMGFS